MSKGLTYGVITSILADISARHTNNLPHKRINTFAVIDSYQDLESPLFNKTDRDIELGHFWSRYKGKADDICLFVMQESCRWKASGEKCIKLLIGVAQATKCVGCPENVIKTPDEVDVENEDVLRAVYDQLKTYQFYKDVEFKDDPNPKTIITTPEQ